MDRYWLSEWLDAEGVDDTADLERVLADTAALDRAAEHATAADEAEDHLDPRTGIDTASSIVASRALDLSSLTTCSSSSCMRNQLDEGLAATWQYFDTVVVEGLAPHRLEAGMVWQPWMVDVFRSHIEVLLHAEEIGALDHLQFRTKPHAYCADHFREHAIELGLAAAVDESLREQVVAHLERRGTVEAAEDFDGAPLLFRHPDLEVTLPFSPDEKSGLTPLRYAAEQVFDLFCLAAVADAALADELGTPLGKGEPRRFNALAGPDQRLLPEDAVAINLDVPILKGLSAEDLLKVRDEHRDEYVRFRASVTEAIRQRVKTAGDSDPRRLADEIVRDVIEPELATIRSKLESSQRAMDKKMLSGVFVGSVITTVGLVTAMPVLVVPGLAAIGGAITLPASAHIDSTREIELSDMYFLHIAEREFGHM